MRLAAIANQSCRVRKQFLGMLVLMLAIAAGHAQSQFPTSPKDAAISGTVYDPTGAPVPQATITLKSKEGFILQAESDQNGRFAIEAWPGEYTLRISSQGFRTFSEPASLTATTSLAKRAVLQIDFCSPCVTVERPAIALEPGTPLTATLQLQPLPPFKLHHRDYKNRAQ